MSNNYFKFKQFTVQQDQCAMKVCTDACLFGAWAGNRLQLKRPAHILDIGTGTGLLSLMLAQQNMAAIEAVEIDPAAFLQAKENFAASPFTDRLQITNADIAGFTSGKKYDGIISNPPFFEDDLKSPQQNKNAAKHDTTLTLPVLLHRVKHLLTDDGWFAVLLPFHRADFFVTQSLQQNLFCNEKVVVRQTPGHHYFRAMLLFSANKTETANKEISIKDGQGNYTPEFISLLKDYYLYL
jgi:tRNA1Val (adenine37-N6)-methyltransferase